MIPYVVLGAINGLTVALLALGLVLIFKAARFVNFAHAQLGVLSSLLLAKLVLDWGLPYWMHFEPLNLGDRQAATRCPSTWTRRSGSCACSATTS